MDGMKTRSTQAMEVEHQVPPQWPPMAPETSSTASPPLTQATNHQKTVITPHTGKVATAGATEEIPPGANDPLDHLQKTQEYATPAATKPKANSSPDRAGRNRAESKSPNERPKTKSKPGEHATPPAATNTTQAIPVGTERTTSKPVIKKYLGPKSAKPPVPKIIPPHYIRVEGQVGASAAFNKRFTNATKHAPCKPFTLHTIKVPAQTAFATLCQFHSVKTDTKEAAGLGDSQEAWDQFVQITAQQPTNSHLNVSQETAIWTKAHTVALSKTSPQNLPGAVLTGNTIGLPPTAVSELPMDCGHLLLGTRLY